MQRKCNDILNKYNWPIFLQFKDMIIVLLHLEAEVK